MIDKSSVQMTDSDVDYFAETLKHPAVRDVKHDVYHEQKKIQSAPRSLIYDLTIVIPTRNERDNVVPLLQALQDALKGVHTEIIFVDDSDDDTPQIIKNESAERNSSFFTVRLEHRPKGITRAGGLATAVSLGISVAQADYVAVIDADLQHPPEQLRVLYDNAIKQDVDLVLATRYIPGGGYEGLDGVSRLFISVGFKWVAKLLFPEQLIGVSDPLGGFFLFRRAIVTGVTLRPIGYKILLDILVRCQWKSIVEVPYHFHARTNGTSKADTRQGVMALQHMGRLLKEVPRAGRLWKICALVLLNVVVIEALLTLFASFLETGSALKLSIFAVISFIDFILLNIVIFPRIHIPMDDRSGQRDNPAIGVQEQAAQTLADAISVYDKTTKPMPSVTSVQNPTTPLPKEVNVPSRASIVVAKNDIAYSSTKMLPVTPIPVDVSVSPVLMREPITPLPTSVRVYATASMSRSRRMKDFLKNKVLSQIPLFTIIIAIGWIVYALPGAWLILAALLVGLSMLARSNSSKSAIVTMMLGVAVGLSIIDYLTWRFEVTNWAGWWIAVPLLGAEMLGAIHTLGFQYTLWPWRQPQFKVSEDPTQHPIFVFVPTVNEGASILEPTLKGIIAARKQYLSKYPHGEVNIIVCNDGFVANDPDWRETEELATQLGVQCITRTVKGGAKAGNIEHARQQIKATGDALLVIFDADQIAKPDFFLKTIPPFADRTIGWVQTGQYYHNLENPVSRWADDQQAMFYNLLCPGKAAINSAFICGTNVVIRAEALDQIGGLPQDSVTEDFSASIALHSQWHSIFLTDVLATGLGPLDMPSYLKQQRRWAIGTLGVIRSHWRQIFLPAKNGLSIEQRLQYLLACTHYLCGLRDLIYLLCPILFIIFGVPAVRGSTLGAFLWHFLPYLLASSAALWYSGRGITGLRGIVMGFGCFPVLLESLLSVILQKKIGFSVTSKQRGTGRSWNHLVVHILFMLASVAAIVVATQVKGRQVTSMFISVMWVVYALCMLGSFLWLSVKDMRSQEVAKQPTEVGKVPDYPSRLLSREQGLRPAWNLVIAFCLASFILIGSGIPVQSALPTRFAIGQQNAAQPYLGVSLPMALLKSRPATVASGLDAHLGIVGRTQDVHDLFDHDWVNQLDQQHERPWITLEFGVFDAAGKPPVDANLTSIINGVHDGELTRWAHSVRDYGKPTYLTVLLHADRNWSLSSAVANGGIPQDAPRAWIHIQAIFKAVGATNVAWVWSPADPAHDAEYAPPASTINCVLLSLISYPGTTWVDPAVALHSVVARYPTKPILLEVSANGPAAQKATWLTQVGKAVLSTPGIHALIYHEGSPRINATLTENTQWSLLSDQDSLTAMRQIASSIAQSRH